MVYGDENPYATEVILYHHEFKVIVWAGVIHNFIIGSPILPHQLISENYLEIRHYTVQNSLEDLPSRICRNMGLMDGHLRNSL